MPRPLKKRYVCCEPQTTRFSPEDACAKEEIILTVDEYETLRLIDLEGLSREECASQMQVSRTTVQSVYNSARFKVADMLVNAKRLRIEGGDYRLGGVCSRKCTHGCPKHCCTNHGCDSDCGCGSQNA